MLRHEIQVLAARHLPGGGEVMVQPLRNGLVNETYRVLRDGHAYALRVASRHPFDLGQDRSWEARVLERAVAADLAPAVEYCDPRQGILITRWVDGGSWTAAQATSPSNTPRIAAVLRRIHALTIPTPPREMNPRKWIDYYRKAAPIPEGGAAALSAAAGLSAAADAKLAALAALPGVDAVLCHSDLHTLNLIDRGDSVVLLDWEYAHAADPAWDLAGWSANNDFSEELRHALLKEYLERAPTRLDFQRLQLSAWLYDYVCLMWSELYLKLHGETAEAHADADAEARGGVSARAELLAARLTISACGRAD
jgi:thiamine kinase-like enzyme